MKKFVTFIKESREELKKVSWPSREEVSRFTMVTIITVIIMAVFMYIVDLGLMQVVNLVMR